jgi:hypothetical protein
VIDYSGHLVCSFEILVLSLKFSLVLNTKENWRLKKESENVASCVS